MILYMAPDKNKSAPMFACLTSYNYLGALPPYPCVYVRTMNEPSSRLLFSLSRSAFSTKHKTKTSHRPYPYPYP